MANLFGWMRGTELHPLLVSCVFRYEFEFAHPFFDGNGRTERLWQILLLSCWRPALAWLPIESVIRDRQAGYYAAIAQSNAAGTCDALVPYVVGGSVKDDDRRRALGYFSENPKGTVAEFSAMSGMPQRSVERLVAKLKDDGRLVREGSPRSGSWRVVS